MLVQRLTETRGFGSDLVEGLEELDGMVFHEFPHLINDPVTI